MKKLLIILTLLPSILCATPLRDQIAQLLIVGFHDSQLTPNSHILNHIQNHNIGGVILFYGNGDRNIQNPQQLKALTQSLQAHATTPLIISIDEEGGLITRLPKDAGFSHINKSANELGKTKPTHTLAHAKQLATTLKDFNINTNFAPVVDLKLSPDNFIARRMRTFSSDRVEVSQHANAFINGMHSNNIITCLKHFPGHGSSTGDTHKGLVNTSSTWDKDEIFPYRLLIKNGYNDMIMTTHCLNAQIDSTQLPDKDGTLATVPMTFSNKALTQTLRNQFNFQGVVVTDDITMGALANNYSLEQILQYTLNAGADMIILANHEQDVTHQAIDIIENLVNTHKIPKERIHQAYTRVQTLKQRL